MASDNKIFGKPAIANGGSSGTDPGVSILGYPNLIVLGISSLEVPNVQLVSSLEGSHHILDFGERLVSCAINGLVPIIKTCSDLSISNNTAIDAMYVKYRIGSDIPLKITIGGVVYDMFITQKSVKASQENAALAMFELRLIGEKSTTKAARL